MYDFFNFMMTKPKVKWKCSVCEKVIFMTENNARLRKTCSYTCRNKSEYHRECNSKSKKGISIPWNKGISGYTTSRKGMKHNNNSKELMKKNSVWKNRREEIVEKYFKNKNVPRTKYEELFIKILEKNNIEYKEQFIIDNKYQVDFLINNIVIEIDGEYHNYIKKEDSIREDYIKKLGYKVIRIKHEEIDKYGTKQNNLDRTLSTIKSK